MPHLQAMRVSSQPNPWIRVSIPSMWTQIFFSTDAGPSFPSVAPDDEDIPQISYEGDEPTGTDIPSSFASYVEGCTKKKIKKEDLEVYRQRYTLQKNCPFLKVPSMDKEVWRCMSRDQKHSDVLLQAAQAKIGKAITATVRSAFNAKV